MEELLSRESRVRALTLAMLIGLGAIIVRLFFIQIISHQKYVVMAEEEQIKKLVIPARRGTIYAMDGLISSPLVMNEIVYTMFIDPEIVISSDDIKTTLKETASENIIELSKMDKKFDKSTGSRYQVLAINLNRQQAEHIKAKKFRGVGFQAVTKRVYPEGALAAQLLGFVNSNGGQYGVEGGLNKRLTGLDGMLESVTDIAEVPLTIGDKNVNIPAQDGDDLVLSIDKNIQYQVEKILQAKAIENGADYVSAIVIDPNDGRVRAMANYPSYNPSEFYKVTDAALFNNRVAMSPYEPGSIIKAFTVGMGLDKGLITPSSTYNNTDVVQVGDRKIYNALKGHTGIVTMQQALRYSLNTGMVDILSRAGGGQINRQARDQLYNYFYNVFGLGKKTGIEIPEAVGLIISPDKIEGNAVRYANMTFGQGMNLTMLQVAAGFSSLINGGNYYQPTVLAGQIKNGQFVKSEAILARSDIISSATSNTIRQMLAQARADGAYSRLDPKGFEIAGKTGTSETLRDGVYVKDETIASYLGYGGGERPEYVIMTQISGKGKNMEGSIHAVPIFNEISDWLVKYLKIEPKG